MPADPGEFEESTLNDRSGKAIGTTKTSTSCFWRTVLTAGENHGSGEYCTSRQAASTRIQRKWREPVFSMCNSFVWPALSRWPGDRPA